MAKSLALARLKILLIIIKFTITAENKYYKSKINTKIILVL